MEDTRSGSGRDGCRKRKERERYNGEIKEQEEIAVPCDAEQGIEEELHVAAQRLHASWTMSYSWRLPSSSPISILPGRWRDIKRSRHGTMRTFQ
eukprot:scaffold24278_cov150-Skeletonema_marinoi.AAC.8